MDAYTQPYILQNLPVSIKRQRRARTLLEYLTLISSKMAFALGL